jgi:hypothetical protein
MGFLEKLNPDGKSTINKLAEAAEYSLASYGYGWTQNRYRERASLGGIPADLLTGGVMKAASIAMDLWHKGKGVSPYANLLGNAGLGAFFHTLGAGHGAQSSGVTRLLIKDSDVAKAKAALPGATILGEIPKAPHGDFLSASDLAAMSR